MRHRFDERAEACAKVEKVTEEVKVEKEGRIQSDKARAEAEAALHDEVRVGGRRIESRGRGGELRGASSTTSEGFQFEICTFSRLALKCGAGLLGLGGTLVCLGGATVISGALGLRKRHVRGPPMALGSPFRHAAQKWHCVKISETQVLILVLIVALYILVILSLLEGVCEA